MKDLFPTLLCKVSDTISSWGDTQHSSSSEKRMPLVSKHIKKHSPECFDYSTFLHYPQRQAIPFAREWQILLTRAAVSEHHSHPVRFETCAVIYEIFPPHLQVLNLKSPVTAEICKHWEVSCMMLIILAEQQETL